MICLFHTMLCRSLCLALLCRRCGQVLVPVSLIGLAAFIMLGMFFKRKFVLPRPSRALSDARDVSNAQAPHVSNAQAPHVSNTHEPLTCPIHTSLSRALSNAREPLTRVTRTDEAG